MTWNHRVVKYSNNTFGIHEVYYNEVGVVDGVTESAVSVVENSVDDMRYTLLRMLASLDKEVIDYDSV